MVSQKTRSLSEQRDQEIATFETSEEDDEDDEDEDDELPAMMEKPALPVVAPRQSETQVAIQAVDDERPQGDNDNVNDSLPRFHEPLRVSQKTLLPKLAQVVAPPSRGSISTSSAQSAPSPAATNVPQRTALHQQLIDQTLRHKRQEIVSQAFVRWCRGLRLQSQHRQQRMQQSRDLQQKLVRLKRNHIFFRWKAWTAVTSQVVSCRVDAFQQRVANRLVARVWNQWQMDHLATSQRHRMLRSIMLRLSAKSTLSAFHRWKTKTDDLSYREKLVSAERQQQQKWDARMSKVAEKHHTQRGIHPMLSGILRGWNAFAKLQRRKLHVLRKITLRGSSKVRFVAWRKWMEVVLLARHATAVEHAHSARAQETLTEQRNRHQQLHTSLQETHAKELLLVRRQLQEKEQELQKVQLRDQEKESEVRRLQTEQKDRERQKVSLMVLHMRKVGLLLSESKWAVA